MRNYTLFSLPKKSISVFSINIQIKTSSDLVYLAIASALGLARELDLAKLSNRAETLLTNKIWTVKLVCIFDWIGDHQRKVVKQTKVIFSHNRFKIHGFDGPFGPHFSEKPARFVQIIPIAQILPIAENRKGSNRIVTIQGTRLIQHVIPYVHFVFSQPTLYSSKK
jgi:hypothetical protein